MHWGIHYFSKVYNTSVVPILVCVTWRSKLLNSLSQVLRRNAYGPTSSSKLAQVMVGFRSCANARNFHTITAHKHWPVSVLTKFFLTNVLTYAGLERLGSEDGIWIVPTGMVPSGQSSCTVYRRFTSWKKNSENFNNDSQTRAISESTVH